MKDGEKMTEVKVAQSGKGEWKIVEWLKEYEDKMMKMMRMIFLIYVHVDCISF